MRIKCSVEVVNRALPSLNMTNKRAKKSILTIGKSNDDEHFICHQTNENLSGYKYKVKNNITNVFVKCLNEGKATIRFKEPNHDLAINCNPIQLEGFLRTLKLCLAGINSAQLSSIHGINNKSIKPIKTKLIITSKEEYPVLEGFPRTLQKLLINDSDMKRFDSRILRLQHLEVLSLDNNGLTTLPETLGASLRNLSELYLGNNSLGESKDWRWIVNRNLSKKLKLLDLSSNKIEMLPDRLGKLESLITLKLNNNLLKHLPNGIRCMKKLRYFSVSNNKIAYFPRSFFCLRLDSLDVSKNPFCKEDCQQLLLNDFQEIPSLLDLAASYVVKQRLRYSVETVPQTLIDYIEDASFCICGNPCFSSQPVSYISYQKFMCGLMALVTSQNNFIPVSVRFCSFRCYTKHCLP